MKFLFAALFICAGFLHFWKLGLYMKAVPFWVPWPAAAVIFTGAVSALLGAALLIPRLSRFAAAGIILFLMAVFPANLHMALHPEMFPQIPVWVLGTRLPLQAVLIAWAFLYIRQPAVSKIDKTH